MSSHSFIELLKAQLLLPLPGKEAQKKMAPYRRLVYDIPDIAALNPKKGSILILIYPHQNQYLTAYIKRTEYKGVHSGQVSFPGGKFDPTDIKPENTALREAQEEIGINASGVEIIGRLTELYIPPSNFLVSPFVGFVSSKPIFEIEKREVASLIEVNLNTILDASENVTTTLIKTGSDIVITAPAYQIQGYVVWGATAMITSEFIEVMKGVKKKI